MKLIYASEYRAAARNMLCGRWTEAVLVGLVASLLCGGLTGGNTITFNFSTNNFRTLPQNVYYTTGSWALSGLAMTVSTIITILAVLAVILMIVVGGVVETGYARYNMEMVNGAPSGIRDLFTDFSRWGTCLLMQIIRSIIILIGSILLVVPGIIASYGMRMAPFILAEHPDYTGWQAIKESWDMMKGHKWRFFCLEISFIGWAILSGIICGIGLLWLTPYRYASYSIFYLELAGDYYSRATVI